MEVPFLLAHIWAVAHVAFPHSCCCASSSGHLVNGVLESVPGQVKAHCVHFLPTPHSVSHADSFKLVSGEFNTRKNWQIL